MSRRNTRLALALALMVGGCTSLAWADDPHAHASKQYDTYCAQCHGMQRNGKGVNSETMSTAPRDHSDPKGMGDIPEAEMLKVIKEGGLSVNKSALMPAWGSVLSDAEIEAMVKYLHHVCNCGAGN